MATQPATPAVLSEKAQESVSKYFNSALTLYTTNFNIRGQLEKRDRAYYREEDQTTAHQRAKAANEAGDSTKLQNMTVPVVMPQVETALADLQEIFLSSYPIFGTVAPPELMEAATQMDTVVGENSILASWPLHILQTLRDGLKYDLGAIEVAWENRKIWAVTTPDQSTPTQGAAQETYYAGNYLKHLDAYNLILDTRVSPDRNHLEGEFAGYTEMISRIELKKRMENLDPLGTMNFRKAFESPSSAETSGDTNSAFYVPSINPDALIATEQKHDHNWLSWANLAQDTDKPPIQYKDSYEYSVLYARILPSDFNIHSRNKNHVQIWKFILVNRSVVIFAERQTNAHNVLPIIVCKPSADALGWQSKSFAENVIPTQHVATSLTNSGLESQRRKVYDRMFYDPSRINKKDIDVVSSVARIPVKNSQYGKSVGDAVHVAPYRDEGVAEVMQLAQQVAQSGDIINGQNRVSQGQFQRGNKSRKEFETVMGNANNRTRLRALALEFSFFQPIKTIIKSNILQYQPPVSLVNSDTKQQVKIDPELLRKANLSFALSDGYMPSEKMVSSDLIGTVFQAAQAMPEIRAEYDLMGMFVYSMQLQGANWLGSFKRNQQQKAEFMQTMQQASSAAGTQGTPPSNIQPNGQPGAPSA